MTVIKPSLHSCYWSHICTLIESHGNAASLENDGESQAALSFGKKSRGSRKHKKSLFKQVWSLLLESLFPRLLVSSHSNHTQENLTYNMFVKIVAKTGNFKHMLREKNDSGFQTGELTNLLKPQPAPVRKHTCTNTYEATAHYCHFGVVSAPPLLVSFRVSPCGAPGFCSSNSSFTSPPHPLPLLPPPPFFSQHDSS